MTFGNQAAINCTPSNPYGSQAGTSAAAAYTVINLEVKTKVNPIKTAARR